MCLWMLKAHLMSKSNMSMQRKHFHKNANIKNILTFILGFESLWQKSSTQRLRIKQLRAAVEYIVAFCTVLSSAKSEYSADVK